MPEVALVRTPIDPADLRDLVIAGHISAAGAPPNYARLGVGWAQLMLESGRGQSCWNYNPGNIKCSSDYCREEMPWVRIPTPPGSSEPPIQRAYPGPVEGCAAYWRLIASRWPQALGDFDHGRPREAMYALYNRGQYPSYFEAEPTGYASSVARLFKEYEATFPRAQFDPGGPGPAAEPQAWETVAILGGVGLALGAALYFWTR
jgi:hypothetical protein